MFRNKSIGAMILAMSAVATAAADASVPPADATTAGRPGTCTLDTERYVQSELDWRSYYLNRLGASRQDDRPAGPVSAPSALVNGS